MANSVSQQCFIVRSACKCSYCLPHTTLDYLKLLKLLESSCNVSDLRFASSSVVLGDGEKAGRINYDMSTAGKNATV